MKIDVKYNDLKTKFEDLELGDTFANAGTIYMKISTVVGPGGGTYNAVRLSTGTLYNFADDDSVASARVVAHTEVTE